MNKDKPTGDPFPQLSRRNFYADEVSQSVNSRDGLPTVRKFVPANVKYEDPLEAPKPRAKAQIKVGELAKKAGRPIAPKPWIEAGVSRMTWHRREKKAKASRDGV